MIVVNGLPIRWTAEFDANPAPLTVSTKPPLPACTERGIATLICPTFPTVRVSRSLTSGIDHSEALAAGGFGQPLIEADYWECRGVVVGGDEGRSELQAVGRVQRVRP
jgi:hypothetical protein